jgi:hypothetical protein
LELAIKRWKKTALLFFSVGCGFGKNKCAVLVVAF